MRTGRLSISRGHELARRDAPAALPAELRPTRAEPPCARPEAVIVADYSALDERLSALERLARLFEHGALSAEEFAAEKALVLAYPVDELLLHDKAPVGFVPAEPRAPRPGPSLVGRMLSARFLLLCVVCGLGFSFAVQPHETGRLFEQTLHLFA